ncbi:hypothetical protein ABT224_36330 [Streptomyces sp. NPDC001584]|uniref:hypothetical protein n=1 Tax=Streptomyces sp. NPDC001584 TaxID=3154521 RepID=UPI0033241227
MIEYVGQVEDGLPVWDVRAHAWLPGPSTPGIIYTHQLTVALVDDSGALADPDAVLTRARQLGWVKTSDYDGWAAPCPGWEARLAGEHLLVRQPDGAAWYDGTLPATEAWRAAARKAGQVYHFTAATNDVNSIAEQIASGEALAVVSTLT